MPSSLFPPNFPTKLELIHRVSLDPMRCLTPPRPWAPLTDAEWDALAPYLAAHNCGLSLAPRAGRPPTDTRARLDAIFRAVTLKRPKEQGGGRGTWAQLPPEHGKPDTVSRTHRRWARANLWARLLAAVACPLSPPVLRGLAYFVCCAFRRAIRAMGGLRAIVLARRLRLHSALPAPSPLLPDPDLSERVMPVVLNFMEHSLAHPGWWPSRGAIKGLMALVTLCGGRSRIQRWMEPA